MINPPLDLPAHTGSRTTRLLGATVLVGVVTMILLGFFVPQRTTSWPTRCA